ncbi:MAG: tetratricopeptide repeat protein [Myxococcota bacterium]
MVISSLQKRHDELRLKWKIEQAEGSVRQFAVEGQWGEARVLAEKQFLLSPNWETLETWLYIDSFSPYPRQWSGDEKSVLYPYLSKESQLILSGLEDQEQNGEAVDLNKSNTMWAKWYELRKAEKNQSSEAQLVAAQDIRIHEPTHSEACLYLIRDRKSHRDFAATGRLLKECHAKNSKNPSLKRQLADFYDEVGEHLLAIQTYTEQGMGLHALMVTYQESIPFEYDSTLENLVNETHINAAIHAVWLGIYLGKQDLIRSGISRLVGRNEPVVWAALASGYLALGEPNLALAAMEKGDGVSVNTLRGRAYLVLGRKDDAKHALEQAHLIHPWNPWILVMLATVDPKYKEILWKKDPLETKILGHYRDRYRPWNFMVPLQEFLPQLDTSLVEHITQVIFNDSVDLSEDTCLELRACWALWSEEPEQDERWTLLSDVEKRYVSVFKSGVLSETDDTIHDRDWYASGLHRLIVLKGDNLP